MTEKIIIDVSGCCCYENGKCLWTKRYYENNIVPVCEKVKDCYYKQLRHLEQENKELKETIEAFKIMATVPTRMYNECEIERCKYGRALEEIRDINKLFFERKYGYPEDLIKIDNIINEVLQ